MPGCMGRVSARAAGSLHAAGNRGVLNRWLTGGVWRLTIAVKRKEVGMVYTSKISSKGQITIPAKIRSAMGTRPGDLVVYELEGKTVRLKKVEPFDAAYHAAVAETLVEWNSPEDQEAFGDL